MNQIIPVGQPMARLEDQRFLQGTGTYIDDMVLDNQAHAFLLRSPFAHATILSIDADEARAQEGVLLVMTGEEWVAAGYKPIPCRSGVKTNRDGTAYQEALHHCLAVDKVRHAGEAVALVVAETYAQARAAADLIFVDYDDLPVVTTPQAALAPGAPRLWDHLPDNVCLDFSLGTPDETEAAFADAAHVISLELVNNRVTAVPMEPRGCLAAYDASSGRYTLWNSSQNIHANRGIFAEMLGLDADRVDHIAPDVGGGFGAKNSLYAEPPLMLHAAKAIGRPVKWVAERTEAIASDTHGRDQTSTVRLALDADHRFLALHVATLGNIGAWCGTVGPFTPTGGSARTQGGPYLFPAMHYEARAVFTNTVQTDPYRGAGRPEASYQIERIIDYAASHLGVDRFALRRKNLIPSQALPHVTPMGLSIDSGAFAVIFDQTLALADHDGFAQRAAAAREADPTKRRGFACVPYLECTGGGPKEEANVTFAADGTLTLAVGSHSTGMSHETVLTQLLSAHLHIDPARVAFRQADTRATALGGGHGGSRGMEVGGNAVQQVAGDIVEKARAISAHLLNSTAADMAFDAGRFRDSKTGQEITFDDVAAAARDPARLPESLQPAAGASALDTTAVFEREAITIPNGVHAAEVEVDIEMGTVEVIHFWAVDDFGRILNPMTADGQVMGGVAQGIGQALYENVVYDEETGQLMSASFMDYCVPRADHMPPMTIIYYEDAPTSRNPLGVKGAGEAGCCGAPPAIVNAVCDALREFGVTHIDMPLTPEKIWRAIEAGKAGPAA